MTQYAPKAIAVPPLAPAGAQRVQKVFHVMVRSELDGVFMGHLDFTVAMTGTKGSQQPDRVTIDGQEATLEKVASLYQWSQDKGRFELLSERAVAEVGA